MNERDSVVVGISGNVYNWLSLELVKLNEEGTTVMMVTHDAGTGMVSDNMEQNVQMIKGIDFMPQA